MSGKRPDPDREARDAKIVKLWDQGLSTKAIGERLRIHRQTALNALHAAGRDTSVKRHYCASAGAHSAAPLNTARTASFRFIKTPARMR